MQDDYDAIFNQPTTIELKGGTVLTLAEAKEALDKAITIIECVGTTGIHSKVQKAGEWMRRYYPQWE
jgi:hypothetical protein